MTNIKRWSKEDLAKRVQKLERENKELMRLQSTYSICLSALLLEQHETLIQAKVQNGEEIEYWLPVTSLQRISDSQINISQQVRGNTPGAHISLILPKTETIKDGKEAAADPAG